MLLAAAFVASRLRRAFEPPIVAFSVVLAVVSVGLPAAVALVAAALPLLLVVVSGLQDGVAF